jgi:thymidylate synthase (FAD)
MRLLNASYDIMRCPDGKECLKWLELIGRICYKSEGRITATSAEAFVRKLLSGNRRKHLSVLEHETIRVRFICDRAISHQLVRHRHASPSQESQRFCNYTKGRFDGNVAFVLPSDFDWNDEADLRLLVALSHAEDAYFDQIRRGKKPQRARKVLPNAAKTEVVLTANLRAWRNILFVRSAPDADPDMRALMVPLLADFQRRIPVVFDDISEAG